MTRIVGVAHVGAVKVQANALTKLLDIILAEAGVAASSAVWAQSRSVDRIGEQLDVEIEGRRVRFDHRLRVVGVEGHRPTLSVRCSVRPPPTRRRKASRVSREKFTSVVERQPVSGPRRCQGD